LPDCCAAEADRADHAAPSGPPAFQLLFVIPSTGLRVSEVRLERNRHLQGAMS